MLITKTIAGQIFLPSTKDPDLLTAFASDVPLGAGVWPSFIEIGQLRFIQSAYQRDSEGDVQYVLYKQENGHTRLQIFND